MTIIFHRFKRDRRGISNIIVVVLSLVIILAIVSNIILWNYEMSQLDWEKIKEEVGITNVENFTNSTWFATQNEFNINSGVKISGSYTNTTSEDNIFETFIESGSGGSNNETLINGESFEGSWRPPGWNETGRWNRESNFVYDGSFSADFDGGSNGRTGYLTTPVMDCSNAISIYVDFWWYDNNLENNELILQYFDGNTWNTNQDLNQLESENGWHRFTEEVSNNQYFVSNFRIRWWANDVKRYRTGCIDFVTIKKSVFSGLYSLDISGQFTINLSPYPLEFIQTIELQMKYRANDITENWFLKAYNWTASEYSNNGFNSTVGNNPTMGWDYYTLNLTNRWQSYVHNNGTIIIKFEDQSLDAEQTSIDIDFVGVRIKIEGTQFTIKNHGALTLHLVSLWIINSTNHERYDIDIFINSAATKKYIRFDMNISEGNYIIKFISERGNTAIYSEI